MDKQTALKLFSSISDRNLFDIANALDYVGKKDESSERFIFAAYYLTHLKNTPPAEKACEKVGDALMLAKDVPNNEKKAFEAYSRGNKMFFDRSCGIKMAHMLYSGKSVDRNVAKAYKLLTMGRSDETLKTEASAHELEILGNMFASVKELSFKPAVALRYYAAGYMKSEDDSFLTKINAVLDAVSDFTGLDIFKPLEWRVEYLAHQTLSYIDPERNSGAGKPSKAYSNILFSFACHGALSAMYLYCLYVESTGLGSKKVARRFLLKSAIGNFYPSVQLTAHYLIRGKFGFACNPEKGVKLLKMIESEFPPASAELGYCALRGLGMARSHTRAKSYYQNAIDSGDAEAATSFASELLSGEFIPYDEKSGVALLKKTAPKYPRAYSVLGNYYANADANHAANHELALYYFTLARKNGVFVSGETMGDLYSSDSTVYDADDAKYEYVTAIKQNPAVEVKLTELYLSEGSEATRQAAFEQLKDLADNGNADACLRVAYYLLNDSRITDSDPDKRQKDEEDAMRYLKRAVDENYSMSNHLYACLLFDKRNPALLDEILKHLQISIENGYDIAYYSLGEVYMDEELGAKDEKKAFAFWKKGAAKGQYDCVIKTALCYLTGTGTAKRPKSALRLLLDNYDDSDETGLALLADVYRTLGDFDKTEKILRFCFDKFNSPSAVNNYSRYYALKCDMSDEEEFTRIYTALKKYALAGEPACVSAALSFCSDYFVRTHLYPIPNSLLDIAKKAMELNLPEGKFSYLDCALRSDFSVDEKLSVYSEYSSCLPPQVLTLVEPNLIYALYSSGKTYHAIELTSERLEKLKSMTEVEFFLHLIFGVFKNYCIADKIKPDKKSAILYAKGFLKEVLAYSKDKTDRMYYPLLRKLAKKKINFNP